MASWAAHLAATAGSDPSPSPTSVAPTHHQTSTNHATVMPTSVELSDISKATMKVT